MFDEEFTEEGSITSVKDGFAEVLLADKGNCRECSAKLVCRNNSSGGRTLLVENNFGGKEGNRVRISVIGKNILQASFLLYGIPVFLIVFGTAVGMMIFENELMASIGGAALAGIFFLILYALTRSKKYSGILKTEIIN